MHWNHSFELAALCALCAGTAAPEAAQMDVWPPDKAWEWYRAQSWSCGFNYVPSSACNTTEFWGADTFDEPTIRRELGWARDAGFNSCRIFMQYLVWKDDPEEFKRQLGRFIGIADEFGISVAPTFFDDCTFGEPRLTEPFLGRQREPIPGMILPSWTPSPGLKEVTDRTAWPDLERYVVDVVGAFAKDPRIAFWDLYNEPGNSNMGESSTPLMESAFGWARKASPCQPLTVAIWSGMEPMNTRIAALSDIVTYHAYTDLAGMEKAIAAHRAHGRPVICSEWMSRKLGSRWDTDLPLFSREGIGCYCWGLVNGRTQAQFSWDSRPGAPEPEVWFHDLFHRDGTPYDPKELEAIARVTSEARTPASAPLFVDPVFDGAADPTLVWNREEAAWWIFYTARRANQMAEPGVRWCHGTDIGIASSADAGRTWTYRGTARGLAFESGQNSFWAPELVWDAGRYHMFVSYVPGMHDDWSGDRYILHYTSGNLMDWRLERRLELSSRHVIDPCVYRFPDGFWRMWYKDEADGSRIHMAESADLFEWKQVGVAEASRGQEAPNVFRLGGWYWMLTDSGGLNLYRSKDGLTWEDRGPFMREPGDRPDDHHVAQHPDVVVLENTACIVYFVHPFGKEHIEPGKHRSVIQAAKLETRAGELMATRSATVPFHLIAPRDGRYHGE